MNGQAEQHWICRLTNQPHQFSYESGVEVTHVEPGRAEGVLTVGPDSINPHGKVHGGALATLADTVAGCCACARGRSCVTSGSSMEFLRPADGDRITCTAVPKKEKSENDPRGGDSISSAVRPGGSFYLECDQESM